MSGLHRSMAKRKRDLLRARRYSTIWASRNFASIWGRRLAVNLCANSTWKTIIVSSCFSGPGPGEFSFQEQVAKCGKGQIKLAFGSSFEADGYARKLLQQLPGDGLVHNGITSLLPRNMLDQFLCCMDPFLTLAGLVLSTSWRLEASVPCFKNKARRNIVLGGVHVAGLPCFDLLDGTVQCHHRKAQVLLLIWTKLILEHKPAVLVLESLHGFPWDTLRGLLSPSYILTLFDGDPQDFGFPVKRPRKFAIGLLQGQVCFTCDPDDLWSKFKHSNADISAHVFCVAPGAIRAPAGKASQRLLWHKLHGLGNRVVDLARDPAYGVRISDEHGALPVILKSSRLYSGLMDRYLSGLEALAVQGYPVLPALAAICEFPLRTLESFPTTALWGLAGRTMHFSCISALAALVLVCVAHSGMPSPMKSCLSSLGTSSPNMSNSQMQHWNKIKVGIKRLEKFCIVARPFCMIHAPPLLEWTATRRRCHLPLPLMDGRPLEAGIPEMNECASRTLMEFCNMYIGFLNGMYVGRLWWAPKRTVKPKLLHKTIHCRLLRDCLELAELLSYGSPRDTSQENGSHHGYPSLVADKVDNLDKAGLIDPFDFIDGDWAKTVQHPEHLFQDLPMDCWKPGAYTGADLAEYSRLIAIQLRNGKLSLASSVVSGGDVFSVWKSDHVHQRQVWNGSYLSSHSMVPPKPPLLPIPSDFSLLEASDERPLFMSKTDNKCWFDQLRAPIELRRWFALPGVSMDTMAAYTDMSTAEVMSYFVDGDRLPDSEGVIFFPASNVWQMGYSWSSCIAQSTLLGLACESGIPREAFLSGDHQPDFYLIGQHIAAGLATDDFMLFYRNQDVGEAFLHKFKETLSGAGVIRQETKDVTSVHNGTAIGVRFVDGTRFTPVPEKTANLWDDCISMLERQRASPREIQRSLGSLQWNDLLCRPRLAIYDSVYKFSLHTPSNISRSLPWKVCLEILASLGAAASWKMDLTREHCLTVGSSDASMSFGYGVSVAPIDVDTARRLVALAEKRGEYVTISGCTIHGPVKTRIGHPCDVGLDSSNFIDVVSVRAMGKDHIVVRELIALIMLVKWWVRSSANHSKRFIALIDSKSALGAAAKGRSSSKCLLRLLRQLSALLISSNASLHVVYAPTEFNPADAPSRGVRRRPGLKRHVRKRK